MKSHSNHQSQTSAQPSHHSQAHQNASSSTSSQSQTSATPSVHDTPTTEQLTTTLAERTADLQRIRADFENFRKQTELQKQQAIAIARHATVEKFLPLIDDLDRALAAYPDQLSPLQKSITKTITSLGLTRINSEPGTNFNPDLHEAVSVTDDGGDVEVIATTLRPGYLYEGTVLRPAMVQVKRIQQ